MYTFCSLMKNRNIRLVFAMVLMVLTTGCSDTYSTLFIRQVQRPDPEDDCTVTNDPTSGFVPSGVLDRAVEDGYNAALLVGNQMTPRGNNNLLRPESGRIQLYEMEIEVFDFTGQSLAFFAEPISGFADIANSTLPGYGLVQASLLPPAVAAIVDTSAGPQKVVARMRVFGNTLGGSEVDSSPWDFPITVCGAPGSAATCIEPVAPDDCTTAGVPACLPLDSNLQGVDCRLLQDRQAERGGPAIAGCCQ